MDKTTIRRIKIVIVYLVIIIAITSFFYWINTSDPTCNDGKQNQSEKGIDCGGPCSPCEEVLQTEPINIQEVAFAPGGNNTYDVVARISNPNNSIGAKEFAYTFKLKDSADTAIAVRQATSFILPGDTRYVAELGLEVVNGSVPVKVEITIENEQWEKISGINKPQIGVYGKNFNEYQAGSGSGAEGTIRNESSYDLKEINAVIVLRDEKGNIVGINTTRRNSIRAKESQYFRVTWPYALESSVQTMEVDPQANIFDSQNFSASY